MNRTLLFVSLSAILAVAACNETSEGAEGLVDYTPDMCALRGRGCSFDDSVAETDQIHETLDVRVVCDPKSFLYLNGTVVDFEDNLMGRGFKFTNPNASKSCGCGESFSV